MLSTVLLRKGNRYGKEMAPEGVSEGGSQILSSRIAALAALGALCLPVAVRAGGPVGANLAAPGGPSSPRIVIAAAGPPTNGDASGQSAIPNNNMQGDQTTRDVSLPTSPPPRGGLFPETGKVLLDHGVDFHGIIFDHFLYDDSAGIVKHKTDNLARISPALDIDLGKLAGLTGANLHVQASIFAFKSDIPQDLLQNGSVIGGYQTTPAVPTLLLNKLTYEQKLLNDRFSFELGRTSVYNYFFLPNSLDPFNSPSTVVTINGDFPSIPFPVWGGRATYQFIPFWNVQVGAFEDNFRRAALNGNNFGATAASGAQLLAEVNYRSEFNNAPYPGNLELGFEYNTRSASQRTNILGAPVAATPRTSPTNYRGWRHPLLSGAEGGLARTEQARVAANQHRTLWRL